MSARPEDRTGQAILLSLVAIVLFDLMGLVIKHLSPHYSAAELSAYRNVVGLVPTVIALWLSAAWHSGGRQWKVRQWPLACARGGIIALAQLCFYYALGTLPFATAATISYCNAMFMTALAVPLLGERVGPARWSAVLIGFAGVILVMGPGRETFSAAALAPLGAAFAYALAGVLARRIDAGVPSALVNLYSSSVALFGSVLLVPLMGGFSEIRQTEDIGWIAAMGCFGGLAVLCMVTAYRKTEQSNIAPFSYFGIPTAFVFGWLFFDEAPWSDLFPGAILIVIGGLLVIWRERRLRRGRTA
ncbi:DMT family transporter [Seohaeicola zhoushanensis]|uniref:Membrane protein n=1 Tax=Seohaeicola zhoushanensis TaxID=1569283 RepID=A0A8J3M4Y1_9RHOB|nr:DMT family transporter [Seohaeicola zhoushanensis]GHF40741.1 membrane protein [Seohaeicola zhoushanensis]